MAWASRCSLPKLKVNMILKIGMRDPVTQSLTPGTEIWGTESLFHSQLGTRSLPWSRPSWFQRAGAGLCLLPHLAQHTLWVGLAGQIACCWNER
jgi:hypothetical protein